jgi:hypothetical protein
MPDELLHALVDPTAPLPSFWPAGMLGVFLLFLVPIGGGIPFGVLMARDAGLPSGVTIVLYFLSDVVIAFTTEPFLALLRWLSGRVPPLARAGQILGRLTGSAGLQQGGVRGPLGLILLSFTVSPTTGRAAAATAGHGFVTGWTLAIIGDMGYFLVLMVSTLWASSVFGDDRLTIGAVLIATWVLPLLIRRLRRRYAPTPNATASARPSVAAAATASPRLAARSGVRRRVTHAGRRRASRGLR